MGVQQPFMYQPVEDQNERLPYKEFDPKAVTRASMQPRPQKKKKKQEGPLLSFNRHPDSYLIMPTRTSAQRASPWTKNRITQTRIAVLVFRVFQFLGALGAFITMILLTGVSTDMGWVMRITPGVAMLHTIYAIYHLSRKPSGRTPGSSASYMLFASAFDVAIIALYTVSALTAFWQWDPSGGLWEATRAATTWSTWPKLLEGGNPYTLKMLLFCAFLCFSIAGLFHLITLSLSIWLFVLFRKILRLPPDMNPLEDNLTSRPHKRNKSSVSTMSTYDEKQTLNLTSARRSGAPYEDLSRPPSVPFMHTRTNSDASLSPYASIPTTASPRDSRLDLPSRQYQLSHANSPPLSAANLKRASQPSFPPTPPKRGSYTSISGDAAEESPNWFINDSLSRARNRHSQPASPTKSSSRSPTKSRPQSGYTSLQQGYGTYEDIGDDSRHGSDIASSAMRQHANSLGAHPIVPRLAQPQRIPEPKRESALGALSLNRQNTVVSSAYSGDLADGQVSRDDERELRGGERERGGRYEGSDLGEAASFRELTPRKGAVEGGFKSKYYGELGAARPPVLVGRGRGREVSTGNDVGVSGGGGYVRDVSGKVVEEGRAAGQGNGWGARFRKISGFEV